jgi:hypothetical protein
MEPHGERTRKLHNQFWKKGVLPDERDAQIAKGTESLEKAPLSRDRFCLTCNPVSLMFNTTPQRAFAMPLLPVNLNH